MKLKSVEFADKLRSLGLRPTKQRLKICKVLFNRENTFQFTINDLAKNITNKIKKNIIIVGGLSYLFLFLQILFWYQLMNDGHFVSTNTYFSSYYFFTGLHGIHLLGGLFFWGKVSSRIFNLKERDYINEQKNINALSVYWLFLFIVWLTFFGLMVFFNDAVIAWCKELIS